MTEFHAVCVTAVLTTNADLQLWLDCSAPIDAHTDQFTDTVGIDRLKWDRKSVVTGKSVDLGVRGIIKKKKIL